MSIPDAPELPRARTYDELVAEALAKLPVHAPQWTNHNPSDPGITLVELLAYFSELLMYRMERVSTASKREFLRLLTGDACAERQAAAPGTARELAHCLDATVRELSHMECAITGADYEWHAVAAARRHLSSAAPGVRALCVAARHLARDCDYGADYRADGHVTLVVVPGGAMAPAPLGALVDAVHTALEPRCLLGTRLHVSGPRLLHVGLRVVLTPCIGVSRAELESRIVAVLSNVFGPYGAAGSDGEGWPFGRALHRSEIIESLEGIAGVDAVDNVEILQATTVEDDVRTPRASVGVQIGRRSTVGVDTQLAGPRRIGARRILSDGAGQVASVCLRPWELPSVSLVELHVARHAAPASGRY